MIKHAAHCVVKHATDVFRVAVVRISLWHPKAHEIEDEMGEAEDKDEHELRPYSIKAEAQDKTVDLLPKRVLCL